MRISMFTHCPNRHIIPRSAIQKMPRLFLVKSSPLSRVRPRSSLPLAFLARLFSSVQQTFRFVLFLLQIPQIFHHRMYQSGRIIGPGSLMEFLDSIGIGNGVIQTILYFVKNIVIVLLVCRKVFFQFFDNPGTDGITGWRVKRFNGIYKMQ